VKDTENLIGAHDGEGKIKKKPSREKEKFTKSLSEIAASAEWSGARG